MLGRLARFARRALRALSGEASPAIDERERDALRDQIALTEAIVRQIPNAIFTKDAAGRFTMVNRGWSEMSGVPAERAVGKTVHDIYPPEIARRFAEEDARLIAQGAAAEPTEAEHSGPRPGQWRIVKKAVLSREDGTVMGLVATSTDISELKRVQAALADRAKLESDLVDALPISVALRDTECRFVQVNRTWERYFGIRREDAIGKRFSELPGWQANPELVKVAGEAEAIDRELMARGPHAAPLLFEDTRLGRGYLLGRQIFTDAAGRVTGLIATGVDTSELRAAQRALALERERLALLVRSTRAGFSEWDAGTDVVTYSERFKEMLGHAADADTSAWRIFDLMHPDDGPRVLEKFRAMIQPRAGAPAHEPAEAMEYRLRRADGGYLWVRAEGLVQRDDAGRAARFITSYIDITALREQEQSLRDQMVLTSALFDDNPNAMYVKDAQGRYVTVNDAWLKMVGVTREQAIGHTVLELFREKESERYHAEDMRLIAQGEGVSEMESLRTGPDGRPQWVIIRKRVLRRADGTLVGLIGTNTDITPLKRIEAELAERAKFVAELVDAMPISVAMRDTEGRYMLVNRAWEQYFGVTRDAALGRRRRELPGWPTDPQRLADAEEIERLDREMLARGPDYTPEPQETLRLGRYYLMTRRALSDSSGKPIGVVSAGIDMTERRAMEEALAAERQRLALVVRAAQAGIIDWDTAGETAWFSERFKEMLGYAADADTSEWGNIFGALIHPEDRDRSREVFLAGLMSTGAPNSVALQEPLELRLRCADGGWLWVESHGITLRDEAGEAKRYLAAVTDIGKRRAQDEALRNQVKFINDLFDSVPLSLAMRDPEGRFLYVNRTWETYLGMKRDAVLGKSLYQIMPEGEADAIFVDDASALERGPGAPIELSELRFRGRSLMQTRTVMSDAHGRTIGLLVASIDVSERRAMEEALAFERRRLELVVRAFQIGIVDWDGRTHAVFYSPRFREIRGYAPDADTSQWPDYFKVLIHPEDRERVTARWRNFIRGTGPEGERGEFYTPEEYRLLRADGSYVWVQVSGVSVRDEQGFVTRWIAAVTDITERRAHEQQLRESVRLREEVERMSRHDLKTPLNSVIAVSRLLREGARLPPEDEELLSIVERAGYRILNMVNLSLDLFRMEQASYQFRPQAVDLADVADKVAADLYSQAESKGVAVRVRRQGSANTPDGAVLARAEELLCYSMLANVVKNAIEAAPPKSAVTVSFERASETVRVHVHNAGAVPEALRARFFEKYSTSGKSGGLGIGTYSARLMARVQGGEATMRTSEAEGTTISIALGASTEPFVARSATPAQAAAAAKALPPLPELSVLVVDDDEFNRLVVRRYLPSPPLRLAMAVNGLAALDAARREWPDVILLDLEMPVMDGYEAARRLREMERTEGRKRCTIIAFSSNDEQKIIERALGAGCDQYVVKPVPRHVLWQLLIGSGGEVVQQAPAPAAKASDPVVVDEDLRSAIPEFLASRRRLLDDMPAALAAGDRVLFKRLAHRVAGSCALYGFAWAAAEADALEEAAATGEPQALLARAAGVRAHLESVTIDYAPAKSVAK